MQTKSGSLSTLMATAETNVAEKDRALHKALCFGLARHYHELDALIRPLLKKPLKRKDADVSILMMLGVLQIEYMNIATHAAVDTSVTITKALKKPWAKGLVNAVLRNFIRQRDALYDSLSDAERMSFPAWLYLMINADWPADATGVFASNNMQAPMVLRVNQRQQSVTDYLRTLESAGLDAWPHASGGSAVVLKTPVGVEVLPGFNEGSVSVQDAAAQLVAPLLKETIGSAADSISILDACAAPGGKTAHLLECLTNARVTALDVSENRLARVVESLERLQIHARANLVVADATDLDGWWDNREFDAVLLDAPCSGTGVIRRHPDIKLLRREEDIAALVKLQSNLLSTLWNTVKPEGCLLYATCSILKCENVQVVSDFIADRADVEPVDLSIPGSVPLAVGCQLLPGVSDTDGFYYALLKKLK